VTPKPISPYGITKYVGELRAAFWPARIVMSSRLLSLSVKRRHVHGTFSGSWA
jgi:hypothetical protein